MFKKSIQVIVFVLILGLFLTASILASSDVTQTGVSALNSNPAGVGVSSSFGLNFQGDVQAWNNLIINGFMDENNKDQLLSEIEETGWLISSNGKVSGSLQLGFLTGFVNVREDLMVKFPHKIGELVLRGNEIDENYSLDGTEGTGGLYGDTGLNLSFELPRGLTNALNINTVSLGASYHYLIGALADVIASGNMGIEFVDGSPVLEGNGEFTVKYNDVENQNFAKGSAIDLGIYADITDRLSFGFSRLNKGSMEVTGLNSRKYEIDSETEDYFIEHPPEYSEDESLTWNLPSKTKLGMSYSLLNSMEILAAYTSVNYNNDTVDKKYGLGTELTLLNFLPLKVMTTYSTLRNDYIVDGRAGLYLGPIKTEVAASDLTAVMNKAKSAGIRVRAGIEF